MNLIINESKQVTGRTGIWNELKEADIENIANEINTDNNSNSVNYISGVPYIFARKHIYENIFDDNKSKTNEDEINKQDRLIFDEWRGALSCIAFGHGHISTQTIKLKYSDGKNIVEKDFDDDEDLCSKLYEPKGAYLNMLEEEDIQRWEKDADGDPIVTVIKYDGNVIGAINGKTLLYTSTGYNIGREDQPYYDGEKFCDPTKKIKKEDLLNLRGYVDALLKRIKDNLSFVQPLTNWLKDIDARLNDIDSNYENGNVKNLLQVTLGCESLLNNDVNIYVSNGEARTEAGEDYIKLDGQSVLCDASNLKLVQLNVDDDCPLYTLNAYPKNGEGEPKKLTIPLSEKGLLYCGKNIGRVLGLDKNNNGTTKVDMTVNAVYEGNSCDVTLSIKIGQQEYKQSKTYKICPETSGLASVAMWPNFVSEYWKEYYLYSEMPHNTKTGLSNLMFLPFCGEKEDISECKLPIITEKDENGGERISYVGEDKLVLSCSERTNGEEYKYEVYKSEQPYVGIKVSNEDREECGFLIINYKTTKNNLVRNVPYFRSVNDGITLKYANIGVDFGSTNTSVAYCEANEDGQPKGSSNGISFSSRTVSLISPPNKDDSGHRHIDLLFFNNGDKIQSNMIKSMLSIPRNVFVKEESYYREAVSGGMPCFHDNIEAKNIEADVIKYDCADDCGKVSIQYNMKWNDTDSVKNRKIAFLKTLLLQVCAELYNPIDDNAYYLPKKIVWSYPSAMSGYMVKEYSNDIWASINQIAGNDVNKIKGPSLNYGKDNPDEGEFKWDEYNFNGEPMSESQAIAIFQSGKGALTENQLFLCIDIGGSTTDYSAVTKKGDVTYVLQKNSIHLAAQNVTSSVKCCKDDLKKLIETIGQRTHNDFKSYYDDMTENNAQFNFERFLDKMGDEFLEDHLYPMLTTNCKDILFTDLYVTGIIFFYAGQLAKHVIDSASECENWEGWKSEKPDIRIKLSGKGSKICTWIDSIDDYYKDAFVKGYGDDGLTINIDKKLNDIKYEVSKGLVENVSNSKLKVNQNSLEIVGEDGFTYNGEEKKAQNNMEPEMLQNITSKFLPKQGFTYEESQFYKFFEIFKNAVDNVFDSSENDRTDRLENDLKNSNFNEICSYIQKTDEYIKEQEQCSRTGKFEYVAPIILLEAMKFYDDFIVKK